MAPAQPQGFRMLLFFNLQVLHQGIVVRVHSEQQGEALYIPQKAIVQETAESTRIWIHYDVSAWANEKAPSLNDCLETGPTLQNKLWSILIRNRFQPKALAGDLKQAYLQVSIREKDRDMMRFQLSKDLATKEVEPYDSCEHYLVCPHTYIHTCFFFFPQRRMGGLGWSTNSWTICSTFTQTKLKESDKASACTT